MLKFLTISIMLIMSSVSAFGQAAGTGACGPVSEDTAPRAAPPPVVTTTPPPAGDAAATAAESGTKAPPAVDPPAP